MFRRLVLALQDRELRSKILKVIGLLIIARLLTHIPIPGLQVQDLSSLTDNNAFFGLLNVISGGGYGALSFVMLGVSPYITASIVFQLLGVIFPAINEIRKEEGEAGQQKINKWTRWLTIPLAALSAWGILRFLAQQNILTDSFLSSGNIWNWVVAIVALTAGSIIIMWIGEIINEFKVGNGISLMILAGIVAKLPNSIAKQWPEIKSGFDLLTQKWQWAYLVKWDAYKHFFTDDQWGALRSVVMLLLSFLFTLILVVFMNDSVRKLVVVYSRRGHSEGSSRMLDAVKADLPIKVNIAGVVPIIFAVSFILFPTVISTFLSTTNVDSIKKTASNIETYLSPNKATDPTTGSRISEPEELKKQKVLGVYVVNNQADLLTALNYDPTVGGDLFGFTVNNFKTDCNPSESADQTAKDYANIHTKIFGIDLGCGQKLPFAKEFGWHFNGFSAYNVIYFLLIIFFTYFYTANVVFKTDEVSENLQKSGAYIPGVKPGAQTQAYLDYVVKRLNVVGALFLAIIAMIPIWLSNYIYFNDQGNLSAVVGGTTILILVSVAIDTLRQIEAQVTVVDYDQYLKQ